MVHSVVSDTISTYPSQSSGNMGRRLAKDILLNLDPRYSRAVNIYSKYIPSDDSHNYWQGDFNQNRATAVESDVASYSLGRSSILSSSHPSSQPIGSENRGGSVTTDLHQTEYIDDLQTGKKVAYYERLPTTTSHHGDQSLVDSKPSQSVKAVEPKQAVTLRTFIKTPQEHPGDTPDLHSKDIEDNKHVVEDISKPKFREIHQPRAQNVNRAVSDIPSRTLKNSSPSTDRLVDRQRDVNLQYHTESTTGIPQTKRNKTFVQTILPVTTSADGPAKPSRRNLSPAKVENATRKLQGNVLTETSTEGRTQSPKELVRRTEPDKLISSPKLTTANVRSPRAVNERVAESPRVARGVNIREEPESRTRPAAPGKDKRQVVSPGLSSNEPGSRSDRMTTDDNYDTSTYLADGQPPFITPDPSALRDLDNASPGTLDFCDRHNVHYCFFVYFSSATVDEDLMPFRRKSFMEKVVAMENREEMQQMLSTRCGRDAYSDRRVVAIERQSGTEIRLSDLDPDTAFIKGLPRRRLTIGGPTFAHISCAISLFESLLPNVIKSAIFPYRLPQGSSTRYSAGQRISSMHNWENGRSDGTVFLRKQFDDKGGWKSFIPYSKSEINT